jgi:hypothetical protein
MPDLEICKMNRNLVLSFRQRNFPQCIELCDKALIQKPGITSIIRLKSILALFNSDGKIIEASIDDALVQNDECYAKASFDYLYRCKKDLRRALEIARQRDGFIHNLLLTRVDGGGNPELDCASKN